LKHIERNGIEMKELKFQLVLLIRVSKELYAPALGGIMLSIGIGLSMEDFALAFKRFDSHFYFNFCLFFNKWSNPTSFNIHYFDDSVAGLYHFPLDLLLNMY
jgi:hypothetical protein